MQDIVDITFILDASGSMSSIKDSTIDGFNDFLDDQREKDGETRVTLLQFDDDIDEIWSDRPLREAFELTSGHYVTTGCTALNDAVGTGIQEAKARSARSKKPRESIYVIVTDGKENASDEFSLADIEDMIESERDEGREFVFLAANQNAMETASSMNIDPNKSITYAHNDAGNKAAYNATTRVVNSMRAGNIESASFSAAEREEQQEAIYNDPQFGDVSSTSFGEDASAEDDTWKEENLTTSVSNGSSMVSDDAGADEPTYVTPSELEDLSSEDEKAVMKIMMDYSQGQIDSAAAIEQIRDIDRSLVKK